MRDFQLKMRELIATHCITLRQEAAIVTRCLADLENDTLDWAVVIEEGLGHAHRIKGSSGTIGFSEVSAVAQSLEHNLRALDRGGIPPGAAAITQAISLGKELEKLINDVRPEQSKLFDAA